MTKPPLLRKRTAVLVVHGMGSQRPLDTARGVVDAVWLKGDDSAQGERRMWTHPELSGVDIDLPVITTNFMKGTKKRRFDFHELYWAHLMSETRAVAVLLWLFELARRGPYLKPDMRSLYWGALVFLSLLILSVSLLVIQAVHWIAGLAGESRTIVLVILLCAAVVTGFTLLVSVFKVAFKLAARNLLITAAATALFAAALYNTDLTEQATDLALPILIAALVIKFLMGLWGIVALALSLLLSAAGLAVMLLWSDTELAVAINSGWMPWSITSQWSAVMACILIALYLALYASFLQPYLGDAARYFRDSPANVAVRREIRKQAVDTLEALHLCGEYDRIVVVAHSLGTVVAYDMLRAYYGRIYSALPNPSLLDPDLGVVDNVDQGSLSRKDARENGRNVIALIAQVVDAARNRIKAKAAQAGDENLRDWLVTDFVTLGSPLTHALYLMCRGDAEDELEKNFERRTREREFPTCPPRNLDGDGRLTFENPNDHLRYFHHGGQFGLTRWTNLYFPLSQLLWGDAIGGPVGLVRPVEPMPLFGENVADVPVFTNSERQDAFFAHILYWDIGLAEGCDAPHIVKLDQAIDLADSGVVNGM